MTSRLKPRRSDHFRYMRSSISAQSCDSVPPAPGWMVTMALARSCSPPSIFLVSAASTSGCELVERRAAKSAATSSPAVRPLDQHAEIVDAAPQRIAQRRGRPRPGAGAASPSAPRPGCSRSRAAADLRSSSASCSSRRAPSKIASAVPRRAASDLVSANKIIECSATVSLPQRIRLPTAASTRCSASA